MSDFRIASIRAYDPPFDHPTGKLLAHVNVEFGPVLVCGARLMRRESGEAALTYSTSGRAMRVVVRGSALRDRVLDAALTAYRAIAGDNADPAARDGNMVASETRHEPSRNSDAA